MLLSLRQAGDARAVDLGGCNLDIEQTSGAAVFDPHSPAGAYNIDLSSPADRTVLEQLLNLAGATFDAERRGKDLWSSGSAALARRALESLGSTTELVESTDIYSDIRVRLENVCLIDTEKRTSTPLKCFGAPFVDTRTTSAADLREAKAQGMSIADYKERQRTDFANSSRIARFFRDGSSAENGEPLDVLTHGSGTLCCEVQCENMSTNEIIPNEKLRSLLSMVEKAGGDKTPQLIVMLSKDLHFSSIQAREILDTVTSLSKYGTPTSRTNSLCYSDSHP